MEASLAQGGYGVWQWMWDFSGAFALIAGAVAIGIGYRILKDRLGEKPPGSSFILFSGGGLAFIFGWLRMSAIL